MSHTDMVTSQLTFTISSSDVITLIHNTIEFISIISVLQQSLLLYYSIWKPGVVNSMTSAVVNTRVSTVLMSMLNSSEYKRNLNNLHE